MVSLLILKQMYSISDDVVVETWTQNPYWSQRDLYETVPVRDGCISVEIALCVQRSDPFSESDWFGRSGEDIQEFDRYSWKKCPREGGCSRQYCHGEEYHLSDGCEVVPQDH